MNVAGYPCSIVTTKELGLRTTMISCLEWKKSYFFQLLFELIFNLGYDKEESIIHYYHQYEDTTTRRLIYNCTTCSSTRSDEGIRKVTMFGSSCIAGYTRL